MSEPEAELPPPTVAETVSILAEAMAFRRPAESTRIVAAPEVSELECVFLLKTFRNLKSQKVRQAVLDVLVAASHNASGP